MYAIYRPCETCGERTRVHCAARGCPGSGPVCCYVGVSSRGRLCSTITRHFQRWSPRRDGTIPGWTFDRNEATVDHQVYDDPRMALAAEQVWIAERAPILNKHCIFPELSAENDVEEHDAAPPDSGAVVDSSFDPDEFDEAA